VFFQIGLIAPPSNLRHSLATLLAALTRGEPINVYSTIDVALQEAASLRLGMLIVDSATLRSESAQAWEQVQRQWPQAAIVVLLAEEEPTLVQLHAPNMTPVTAGTAAPQLRMLFDKLLQALRNTL
jgi:DNA-binding NarL/FixJ family response regulator